MRALLRLALARGPGGMSLTQTGAWAHSSGVAELTDASLNIVRINPETSSRRSS